MIISLAVSIKTVNIYRAIKDEVEKGYDTSNHEERRRERTLCVKNQLN